MLYHHSYDVKKGRPSGTFIALALLAQLLVASISFAAEYAAGGFHQEGPYNYSNADGQRQDVLVDSLEVLRKHGDSFTYRVVLYLLIHIVSTRGTFIFERESHRIAFTP